MSSGGVTPAAGGGSQTVTVAHAHLSSAELLALNGGVELIAAPGAGKALFPFACYAVYTFGTEAYNVPASPYWTFSNSADKGQVMNANFSSVIGGATSSQACFLDIAADMQNFNLSWDPALVENVSFKIRASSAFNSGDGTLDLYVTYATVTL